MSSPVDVRLSLDSLPTVDLRLLSQSELTALSRCSTHAIQRTRCDDVVIPQIDRSVFNESAGSRKQTYSKLRLATRKTTQTNNNTQKQTDESTITQKDEDNSRIIELFKTLFKNKRKKTETETENAWGVLDSASALVHVPVEYSEVPGGGTRKRGRKTRANESSITTMTVTTMTTMNEVSVLVSERDEDKEKELLNRNGEVVDLKELGKKEDPYGEEIRRQTEGKDLIGFINEIQGQWGSRRKKRKIVDANGFGDALPKGWKIAIAIKKKQGKAWIFCRRYIR